MKNQLYDFFNWVLSENISFNTFNKDSHGNSYCILWQTGPDNINHCTSFYHKHLKPEQLFDELMKAKNSLQSMMEKICGRYSSGDRSS